MKRLLIAETAVERLRPRLAPFLDQLTLLTIDRESRCREAGSDAVPAGNAPAADIGWISMDFVPTGQFDTVMDIFLGCRSLEWVQTFNTGLDDPRYGEIMAAGTRLSNSHAQGPAIAQYVLASVLADWNGLYEARARQAAGQWGRRPYREIAGTTWLVVGYGHIGREIAQRVTAFGGRVLGIRSRPVPDAFAQEVGGPADLARFLPLADVVVLACPLTDATRNLADAAFFAAMRPRSAFVNIGRGQVMDETALLAALDRGTPDLAILDVFHQEPLPGDSPFWQHPRVRLSPHSSALGSGTAPRGDDLFIENLGRYLAGRDLVNEVSAAEAAGAG